jgi:hypothetical protein
MAYLRYVGDTEVYKASVLPCGNIVSIEFEKKAVVKTDGFDLFLDRDCKNDIGGDTYHSFTTVYQKDARSVQYSNDGSVYTEIPGEEYEYIEPTMPEMPEPEPIPEPDPEPEPTLEELKDWKIMEMNGEQQQVIQSGVDVMLTDGTVERFDLKDQDQTSLLGLQTLVLNGQEKIPWHTSDNSEHCKYYSNADMALITAKALDFVTTQVTYFHDLRIYINSMTDKESVESVTYGMYIPTEYQSEVLADIYAARAHA